MSLVRPFAAYLPAPEVAAAVVAPPLGEITAVEWLRLSHENPLSFLHVIRTEVDTEEGGPGPHTYDTSGRDRLDEMIASAVLIPTPGEGFYVYRINDGVHAATGIVAEVDVAGYGDGRVKRHELTRAVTEDLLVEHLDRLRAQSDPVALTHRDDPALAAEVDTVTARPADLSFSTPDGNLHEVWVVDEEATMDAIQARLDAEKTLYITDGHHRCAAAARFAERRASATHMLAALFPESELRLLAFHRCVVATEVPVGQIVAAVARVVDLVELAPHEAAAPVRKGEATLLVDGRAYQFTLPAPAPDAELRARLDVVRLQNGILGPVFGIADPRHDRRLRYVTGDTIPVPAEHDCDACFLVSPPSVADVMAVADAGQVMPPKSTRFEPKVAGGLFVRLIERDR